MEICFGVMNHPLTGAASFLPGRRAESNLRQTPRELGLNPVLAASSNLFSLFPCKPPRPMETPDLLTSGWGKFPGNG